MEVSEFVANQNVSVINEIEVYNLYNQKIDYVVYKDLEYDGTYEGFTPEWQQNNNWGYDNLNDGAYIYSSNYPTGLQNCTFFFGGNGENRWARFIIDLNQEQAIKKITLYVGGSDALSASGSRTPKEVSFFKVNNFIEGKEENSTYSENIKQRNNKNLTLIKSKTFEQILTTPNKFNLLNM